MADPAIRAAQLADLIRDYLATWTAREFPGSFVVITGVTLTPNLRKAIAWVRIPTDDMQLFSALEKKTGHYQHLLNIQLTRFKVPRLSFAVDTRPDLDEALSPLLK